MVPTRSVGSALDLDGETQGRVARRRGGGPARVLAVRDVGVGADPGVGTRGQACRGGARRRHGELSSDRQPSRGCHGHPHVSLGGRGHAEVPLVPVELGSAQHRSRSFAVGARAGPERAGRRPVPDPAAGRRSGKQPDGVGLGGGHGGGLVAEHEQAGRNPQDDHHCSRRHCTARMAHPQKKCRSGVPLRAITATTLPRVEDPGIGPNDLESHELLRLSARTK